MKLLYLYIEDYRCIKNQEFNFDSEIQFHYDWEETHYLYRVGQKNLLPSNFWGNGSVKSISAIVGNNGAGKTTIARFLSELLYGIYDLIEEDYHFIAIFKINDESIKCIYNLKKIEFDLYEIIDCTSLEQYKNDKKTDDKEMGYYIDEISLDLDINLIYHSNHYSSAHEWGFNQINNNFDLSTTSLLYKDSNILLSERLLGRAPEIVLNSHNSNEYKRIILFFQKMSSKSNDISEKIKELIPKEIHIWDQTEKYLKSRLKSIIDRINSFAESVEQATEYSNKLQNFINAIHNTNETFIVFRIKTYIKIALIDACLDNFIDIKNLLDCIQEGDSSDYNHSYKKIIVFFNKIASDDKDNYTNSEIPIFVQQINELIKDKDNDDEQDIKVHESGYVIIKCSENLSKIKQVFEKEYRLFYRSNCFGFVFDPVLSSGEMSFLTIFSRINDYLSSHNSKEFVVYFDEIEITLEPKLQRQIVSYMIDFLNSFENYSFHVIFASHSPILLSDIPNTNVVFLKKVSGKTQVVDHETAGKTFGSNIYTLYKNSFFMDEGLMGEFATSKINSILGKLIDCIDQNNTLEKTDADNIKSVIDSIGEPLIKEQLLRLFTKATNNYDAMIDYHKKEIERIEKNKRKG